MLFLELCVLWGRHTRRPVPPTPVSRTLVFHIFFDVLCGCVCVSTLEPKWGPRRPKWGPRRPETTPRPSQDPQNRGQDPAQDLEIPRSNIEAENSCFFVQKSMILAMIFSCFFDIVVTSSLCFIDISWYSKNAQKHYVFHSFWRSAFVASASDYLQSSLQEAWK